MRRKIQNPKSRIQIQKVGFGTIIVGLTLVALIALAGFGINRERFVTPLYADEIVPDSNQTAIDTSAIRAWLHVEVETNWGWFWQKSTGTAYTTAEKDGKQRVKVGKLCVQLIAHDTTARCALDADSFSVVEKKNGIFISKRTAYVTAWTESPKLGPSRVSLNP